MVLDKIIDILIKESHNIYNKRYKEHACITKAKDKRYNLVHNIVKYNKKKAFFRKELKYNKIVNLIEVKPSIIIDLTVVKKKRTKKRKIDNTIDNLTIMITNKCI